MLNAGVRVEGFDNRNSEGDSYIKMDNMIAPRFGFSWDMKGDGRTKLFGNVGRYFLPVANVINIKQAGGFLDARNWYVFDGFETFEYNGITRQRPILGAQVGGVDTSQGDGTVGDLRSEVDKDMDPVYQDEIILGFQTMINEQVVVGRARHVSQAHQCHRRHGDHLDRHPLRRRARLERLRHGEPGQDRDHLLRHGLRRRERCVRQRGHLARRLGDLRFGRQLPRRSAVREAAPQRTRRWSSRSIAPGTASGR